MIILIKISRYQKNNDIGDLGVVWFFGFVEVFDTFGQKPKNFEKTKKTKKCKTHVGTSWWVRVCNFVVCWFFGFLEVFDTFGQNPKKLRENQKKTKKTKLQDPCRYKLVS